MKTAICAIVKNEERYVREWAEYHLGIGVDSIHVFEDYGSRSHKNVLGGLNGVTVTPISEYCIMDYGNARKQFELYSLFLEKNRSEYDWVLFIDVDEFVMFADGYTLSRLEEEYADSPALWLCWKNYGAGGHIKRPEGGIVDNYVKVGVVAEESAQWGKKSLVNTRLCRHLKNIHIAYGGTDTQGNDNEKAPIQYEKAWINHYFSKSWEDFCERIFERGNMSNNNRTLDLFFKTNPDMQPLKKELIESVRFRHARDTMWLSRDLKIISGGNVKRIEELEKRWQQNTIMQTAVR